MLAARTSFTFPSLVHWHSDLKFPCSNPTVNKNIYLQEAHSVESYLACVPFTYAKYELIRLPLKGCF